MKLPYNSSITLSLPFLRAQSTSYSTATTFFCYSSRNLMPNYAFISIEKNEKNYGLVIV